MERFRERGKYGTNMLRHHPRFKEDYESERELRKTCCTVGLCDVFYDRRLQNDCGNYIPPPRSNIYFLYRIIQFNICCVAWGWGDPHITTIDSFSYTFNGLGEYRMIEIYSTDVFFYMQGRTAKVSANISATEFVALAFYVPSNETIEIQVYICSIIEWYSTAIVDQSSASFNNKCNAI